jgi:Zn-dependent protease
MGNLNDLLLRALGILPAIVVHEYAHGLTASALGDPTARAEGRLTLNPLAHLDPIGLLMLVVFRFGWARPVPVNPAYFRDRRRGMLLVSAAGPVANVALALLSMAALKLTLGVRALAWLGDLFYWLVLYNVWFAIFNLLPVPPLDGSRLLRPFLRGAAARFYWQYESYGWVVLVLLVATGAVAAVLGPLADAVLRLLDRLTFFLG